MTQGRRANDRLDVLIEKLGLTEYENLHEVMFWETDKGILKRMNDNHVNQVKLLDDKIYALMEYLELSAYTQQQKMVVKPIKKVTANTTKKRKYVKPGKYSKKTSNV